MSSFRVGRETAAAVEQVRTGNVVGDVLYRSKNGAVVAGAPAGAAAPGATPPPPPPPQGFLQLLDRITKWIPGDTLALYAPGVTYLASTSDTPNLLFLGIMLVATPGFVLLGAFATGGRIGREVWVSAALAGMAFAIWSLSMPMNGWQAIELIRDNRALLAVGAPVVGALFGLFADGLTVRLALNTRGQ